MSLERQYLHREQRARQSVEFSAALISVLPHFGYSEIVSVQMMSIHLDHCQLSRNLTQDQCGRGIFFKLNKTSFSIVEGI